MDPTEFETKVADAFSATQGWEQVEVTQSSRDDGVDATARKGNTRIGVQMKRQHSSNLVGTPKIREYITVKNENSFDLFVIACSSGFTGPAEEKASESGIELFDGNELAAIVAKADEKAKLTKQRKRQSKQKRKKGETTDPFENTEFDRKTSQQRIDNARQRIHEARSEETKKEIESRTTKTEKTRLPEAAEAS